MAKGNYQSTYATAQPRQNNISDWIIQQEKMNLFMDKYQKDLIKDAEDKKAKAFEASKKRLEESGYGKRTDFKLTGNEALDYNIRQIAQQTLNEHARLEKELRELEQAGSLDQFKILEYKTKIDQLNKVPENLAMAQQSYMNEIQDFQKGGYIMTPENAKRMKKMMDGDYKLTLNPDNYAEFTAIFDMDEDGIEDFIPFNEFMSGKSLGRKVKNYALRDEALSIADQLGTLENTEYNGFYQITTEGLKYDDDQLYNLIENIADNAPDQLNSFAFQKYGKFSEDLTEDEKSSIINDVIFHVKSAINEKHKTDFDSGLAGNKLAEKKFGYQQHRDKIKDTQWWAEHNRKKAKDKADRKDKDPSVLYQDYTTEGSMKVPTYGLNDYDITVDNKPIYQNGKLIRSEGKIKIKATALKAFPDSNGRIIMKVSDGTTEYDLNEADLSQLKKQGITRDKIQNDFKELNKGVNFRDDNNSQNNTTQVSVGGNTYE